MCGITGYTGKSQASKILISNLKRLEYRGYDSSGIAVSDDKLNICKTEGRVERLEKLCNANHIHGTCGIGHTRWATHGKADTVNAHPHTNQAGTIAVVHNGIIENYLELRRFLEDRGYTFLSETDTEVIPHLIDYYNRAYDFLESVRRCVSELEGSFAIGIINSESKDEIIAVSNRSPLVVGVGDDGNYISSDINALPSDTREFFVLSDEEFAFVTPVDIRFSDINGNRVDKKSDTPFRSLRDSDKGDYSHYMLKEIHEQPDILRNMISTHISSKNNISFAGMSKSDLKNIDRVFIIGCGTSFHAGQTGRFVIERYGGINTEVEISSEFRYRCDTLDTHTLVIAITQSGETADTLAAMTMAKERGVKIVAITNTPFSSATRIADFTFLTDAGAEISVASTKAYTAQLAALFMFALFAGNINNTPDCTQLREALLKLPCKLVEIFDDEDNIKKIARKLADSEHLYYIGRGSDAVTCAEGALKMKEITYIHADSYPAGELKHGPIALIDNGTYVVAVSTDREIHSKLCVNISEVISRGAEVVCVTPFESPKDCISVKIPETYVATSPFISVIPLQLLAYYTAFFKGCDVDKPRNLAKSVTVE